MKKRKREKRKKGKKEKRKKGKNEKMKKCEIRAREKKEKENSRRALTYCPSPLKIVGTSPKDAGIASRTTKHFLDSQ